MSAKSSKRNTDSSLRKILTRSGTSHAANIGLDKNGRATKVELNNSLVITDLKISAHQYTRQFRPIYFNLLNSQAKKRMRVKNEEELGRILAPILKKIHQEMYQELDKKIKNPVSNRKRSPFRVPKLIKKKSFKALLEQERAHKHADNAKEVHQMCSEWSTKQVIHTFTRLNEELEKQYGPLGMTKEIKYFKTPWSKRTNMSGYHTGRMENDLKHLVKKGLFREIPVAIYE